MKMNKKVVIGMSGGVDSSVAAYLLKEQGYHVTGVTVQTCFSDLQERDEGGSGSGMEEDAARVAAQLGISHYVVDFRKEFQKNVIDYFVSEYRQGRTPNPCIACNRYIKWEALLQKSRELGADLLATGHYASVCQLENGRYAIAYSESGGKDQSYALYRLTQEQLAHTIFPLAEYSKEDIRRIAEEEKLAVAHKPDSMEICFVPDNDYTAFIERETGRGEEPGNFVDAEGKILGRHRGISHYTVGQRKGLGIAFGEPRFVLCIRPETNEVVLGKGKEVYADRVCATHLNFMAAAALEPGKRVMAKIRYSHQGAVGTVEYCDGEKLAVVFDEPVRAVTPGQALVLYENGYVLGGGTITASPRPV